MGRGSYVYQLDGKEYILTKSESDEVEAYSLTEDDDAVYNRWFLNFVRERNIQPRSDESRAKYWSRISNTGSSTARMATIQRAVTTLIRVASPNVQPGEVKFANQSTSSVDLGSNAKREVTLPIAPIKGKDIHEDIDAVAGYGLHEAYHLNDTVKILTNLMRQDIANQNLPGMLYNFIEDVRVNDLGNKDNPGFEHYIDEAFDRIYQESGNYQLPDEWPQPIAAGLQSDEENARLAGERMAALFGPIQYEKQIGDGSDKPYYDKIKKARELIDSYVDLGRNAKSGDLQRITNELSNIIDVKLSAVQKPQPPLPMTMDAALSGDEGTDESEKIAAAAAAGMEQSDLKQNELANGAGFGGSDYVIVRPLIKPTAFEWHNIGKIPGEVLKADASLRLTRTRERNEDRYMRSGDLDEDELYRLYQGDDRVFIDVTEEVEEEAAIYMCVDSSGSMSSPVSGDWRNGSKTRTHLASQMAWLLAHSMSKKQHVRTKVFAHTSGTISGTTDGYGLPHGGTVIYRIFEKGESFDRLDWLLNVQQGGTPDQIALAVVGKEILQEEVPSKYIIMISDGSPGGENKAGWLEVREVVDALQRKGVHVIQIAVGGINPQVQARMYNNYVIYRDVKQTIKDLAKILDKVR